MICVSISAMDQIDPVLESGADFLELRFDLMKVDPAIAYAKLSGEVKTIATCRPGFYSEEKRISMLVSSLEMGADFCDIEVESGQEIITSLQKQARSTQAALIVSYHDFKGTPEREQLVQILEKCFQMGGTIAKIATTVHSRIDLLNLLSLYDLDGRKVLLGMGFLGRITRIMAPYLGAEFTFAAPGEGESTAPGQLTLNQLNEFYKVIEQS